jgi:hypothetical protein
MEPVQRNTSQQFSASLLQQDFEDAAVDLAVGSCQYNNNEGTGIAFV